MAEHSLPFGVEFSGRTASLHAQAQQLATIGRHDQAEVLYRQLLAADASDVQAAAALGDLLIMQGRGDEGLALLERACELRPDDVALRLRLAMGLQAAARLEQAVAGFLSVLGQEPGNAVAELHLGLVFQELGRKEDALHAYFRALVSAQAQGRWLSPQSTEPELQALVVHAMGFVAEGRRAYFHAALEPLLARYGHEALRRALHCLAVFLGEAPRETAHPRQNPGYLYFPGLPAEPVLRRESLPWLKVLEDNAEVIREEMQAVMGEPDSLLSFHEGASPEQLQHLLSGKEGKKSWEAFFFYRNGKRFDENCARCPKTTAIIESLPIPLIPGHAPEICFSVLKPGAHILKHTGSTNTRIVTHLGLVVPEDCALEVVGITQTWQEGKAWAFDDTYEHEAWNRSDTTRVVLLMDAWNPYLSEAEREAVSALVVANARFKHMSATLPTR